MKRVLVTGASRGIGKAIALRLAGKFEVTVHFNSNAQAAQDVLSEIESAGGRGHLLQFDISDRTQVEKILLDDVAESGAYYGIVSNAGIIKDGQFQQMPAADWDSVIHTNLDSFYNVIQPLLGPMVEAKQKGRIVVLSSLSGQIGNRGQVNYSAAKAGLIGASKALSQEVARRGITVNVIAPGLIKTDMLEDLPIAQVVQQIPMRRLGKPEEVAAAAEFLLSEEASYISGQVLGINGGMF